MYDICHVSLNADIVTSESRDLGLILESFSFSLCSLGKNKGMESLKQYVWDYLIEKSYELLKSQSI